MHALVDDTDTKVNWFWADESWEASSRHLTTHILPPSSLKASLIRLKFHTPADTLSNDITRYMIGPVQGSGLLFHQSSFHASLLSLYPPLHTTYTCSNTTCINDGWWHESRPFFLHFPVNLFSLPLQISSVIWFHLVDMVHPRKLWRNWVHCRMRMLFACRDRAEQSKLDGRVLGHCLHRDFLTNSWP